MTLNDYQCLKCGKKAEDQEEAPTCCGQKMQKIYKSNGVIWKTPGCTRGRAQ